MFIAEVVSEEVSMGGVSTVLVVTLLVHELCLNVILVLNNISPLNLDVLSSYIQF